MIQGTGTITVKKKYILCLDVLQYQPERLISIILYWRAPCRVRGTGYMYKA